MFGVSMVHDFSSFQYFSLHMKFHIESTVLSFFSCKLFILTGVFTTIRFNVIINTVGSNRTNEMVAHLLFLPFSPLILTYLNQACIWRVILICNIGLTRLVSHFRGCLEFIRCTLKWSVGLQKALYHITQNIRSQESFPLLSSVLFCIALQVLNPILNF